MVLNTSMMLLNQNSHNDQITPFSRDQFSRQIKIHKNSKIYFSRKFLSIRYEQSHNSVEIIQPTHAG